MCGVVGLLSSQGPVSADLLARGVGLLAHRGPDGRGTWVAPDGRVGLGAARLGIIDLVTGDQPIASEDERLHVVVNGELYDHERIQGELEGRGHRLRTRSDSEIVLHLYEELGTACLKHLRGEFAFILWDEANGLLFAARDRLGAKPLYYSLAGGTLTVASEVKALFSLGVPARWDHESFFQASSISLDQDRTLFEGVFQVPAGHFLLATPHRAQTYRYWDVDYPRAGSPADRSEEADVERVRESLVESVRLRLRADVPVGCYLSGGIDSSALLGIASRCHGAPIAGFTIAFEGDGSNEAAVAERTARAAGADWFPVPVGEDVLADHFAAAVWHAEALLPDVNVVAKYLLSRAARDRGYKVVLTGEGADEIFGGYATVHRDMLLHNCAGEDPEAVRLALAALTGFGLPVPGAPSLPTEAVEKALGFVPTFVQTSAQAALSQRPLFAPGFREEFAGRDPYRVFLNRLDVAGQLDGREPLHKSLYLLTKSLLPQFLLSTLGDRMEMAHSVEGRLPYLDHRLVEVVREIPPSRKIRGSTEKALLREAVRPFLTDEVYTRRKSVFWSPRTPVQAAGKLDRMMQDVLRSPVLASLPFFSQPAVIGLLDRLPAWRRQGHPALAGISIFLSGITSACVLQERFRMGG